MAMFNSYVKLPEGTHLGIFDDFPLFHPLMVILGRFINIYLLMAFYPIN